MNPMNNQMMGMNNQMMGLNNQMMGMNNQMMGMMGMNNQMENYDISSRVKIIVEPYENKIKDLEEQIRKKDLEIAILKEKLFKAEKNPFNNNFMNNNISNLNQMVMPFGNEMEMQMKPFKVMNMNEKGIENSDIINLIFKIISNESNLNIINQKCFIDDEFGTVQNKVLKKVNILGQVKFIFNEKPISSKLTVSELGMSNNSVILMLNTNKNNGKISLKEEEISTYKINVVFKTTQGAALSMLFDPNISIGTAIKKCFLKIGGDEVFESYKQKLYFLYNARKYTTEDKIILKDLFKNNACPTIIINDVNNLVGAKKVL